MAVVEGLMRFLLAVLGFYLFVTLAVWKSLAFLFLISSVLAVAPPLFWFWCYRQGQRNREIRAFLERLKSSREIQQAEAARIWRAFVLDSGQPPKDLLVKGTINWRVLDFDLEGSRLVVAPANREYSTFAALVGVDPHTRRSFLMTVPGHAITVPWAFEHLYDLPTGFFRKERIHEV